MIKSLKAHTHIWHKTGIILSMLCLVHCLSMPIIVTLLPLAGEKYFSHTSEIYLVIGSLAIAGYILRKDYQKHHQNLPILLVLAAAVTQLLGLFVVTPSLETYFVVVGSGILVIAYLLNFRFHKKVCTNHEH